MNGFKLLFVSKWQGYEYPRVRYSTGKGLILVSWSVIGKCPVRYTGGRIDLGQFLLIVPSVTALGKDQFWSVGQL